MSTPQPPYREGKSFAGECKSCGMLSKNPYFCPCGGEIECATLDANGEVIARGTWLNNVIVEPPERVPWRPEAHG